MKSYPKFIYHQTKAPKIVKTKEEHDVYRDEWRESPADFGVTTHPNPDEEAEKEMIREMAKKDSKKKTEKV